MADVGKRLAQLSPAQREALLKKLQKSGKTVKREKIEKRENKQDFPVSVQQKQLWFLQQLAPSSSFYNMPSALKLEGKTNITALEFALNSVIRRHEVMRSYFCIVDGKPVQKIRSELNLKIELHDFSTIPKDNIEKKIRDFLASEIHKPFNLEKGPLIRSSILRVSETEHILLINMHHIIADGWSVGVIIPEFSYFYQNFKTQDKIDLPPLSLQYADYAQWELNWLKSPQKDKQMDYWKKQLKNCHPVLDFPFDYPRPAIQTFTGSHINFEISKELTSALREFCRTQDVTPYMVLLAVLFSLLYRYTNQEDINVGTAMANRDRPEISGLVGYFMNTLVMRSYLSDEQTFNALLQQIKNTVLDGFANQDLPFEQIIEELHPERDSSRSPYFQILFLLQNAPKPKMELLDLSLSLMDLEIESVKYDITLTIEESENKLSGRIAYNTSLFKTETIRIFKDLYLHILKQVLHNPQIMVNRICLLDESQKQSVLQKWNQTDKALNTQSLIHTLFEQTSKTMSEKTAVVYRDTSLTFSELDKKSSRLARFLQEQGVQIETPVGLYTARSIDMFIALWAILKAGGTFVPLNPAQPLERTRLMIEDANISIIITQANLEKELLELKVNPILIDGQWDQIDSVSETYIKRTLHPDNLAYIIYTSGTSGQPKGIGIRHSSLLNLFYALQDKIYKHQQHHLDLSLNGPLTFDTSVKQWIQLANGHTLHIIPEETRLDGNAMVEFIHTHKVNSLDCTPSQLSLMIESGLFDKNKHQPAIVLVGGEAIGTKLWNILRTNTDITFYNVYGPTECTVDAAIFAFGKGATETSSKPLIGKGVNNTQLYILDSRLQPVPPGISGELCIAGAGLARGYLGKPELTAQKFIPNPFSSVPGSRLYRSGDRARFLPDGNIDFLGRVDRQIKLRGFRIEPGEIEAVIRKLPEIKDVVVLTFKQRLCVFFIPEHKQEIDPAILSQKIQEFLPDYMIPSFFIPIEKMPLTENGKIDYRAFIVPEEMELLRPGYQAPRNELETILLHIWQDALHLKKISVFDSFFQLGGDSLKAAYFINRMQKQLNVDLNVAIMFELKHIAGLSQYLIENFPDSVLEFVQSNLHQSKISKAFIAKLKESSEQVINKHSAYLPFERIERNTTLELSFAQQRLWFLDNLEPGKANYNIPTALRIQGNLSETSLVKALHALVQRHESLRTVFNAEDGKAFQTILDSVDFQVYRQDFSEMPLKKAETAALKYCKEESVKPFDLTKGPLFRSGLLKLANEDFILMLNMHHIVSDGWSIGVIVKDILAFYSTFSMNIKPKLEPLAFQYVDYAAWQRKFFSGDVLNQEIDFWKKELMDVPELLELPTDRPRPSIQTFKGDRIRFDLGKELTTQINALAANVQTTAFTVLMTAFQLLLYRYSNEETIVVGTPVANRTRPELEPMIGFFINTLAIRGDFYPNQTFSTLLTQLKKRTADAFAHQNLPFEKLVDSLNTPRSLSHNPLFQVMFAYQPQFLQDNTIQNLAFKPVEIDTGIAKFDITLSMAEHNKIIGGEWEYNTDLFDQSTMERMLGHFKNLIQSATENPHLSIQALPLLKVQETELLLNEFNDVPPVSAPQDSCLHTLFEKQTLLSPDAPALVYKNQVLSYAELNKKANQLAHFLIGKGIRSESFVGLSVSRSFEMVIGVLGILKAGAAYVPMDPAYPIDRLRYMAEDTGLKLILTQKKYTPTLNSFHAELIELDQQWSKIAEQSSDNPLTNVQPQNMCYVIYTSGSTGKPKGVLLQHNTVINLAYDYIDMFNLEPGKRAIQYFSYSFDGSVGDFFKVLLSGASLYLVAEDEMAPENGLTSLIRDNRLTNAILPPSILSVLPADKFPDLQMVASGGDVCTPELVKHWSKGRKFWNAYGPTETSVCATWYLTNKLPENASNIPIGKPIPNYRIYILDPLLNPTPLGVPGEMYIGGVGVARGYLNRPELSAERFIPDPYSSEPGSRMYASGDLCRYLPDGNIEFLGRIDQQVKIRGFRIELGEIESNLMHHPQISDAIVLAKGAPGNKKLAAYLVCQGNEKPTINNLKIFLKDFLPEYMVPAFFIFLEEMPVAATGKVDKKALPEPEVTREQLESEFVAPSNEKEEILVRIWKDLLGNEKIGIRDNFFELGGDSILSIQVVARANQAGLKITPKQMFVNPTIEGLAAVAKEGVAIRAEQGLVTGTIPLTAIQHAFFNLNLPNRHHWNQTMMVALENPLDTGILKKVLGHLFFHHDVLRTCFNSSNGSVEAVIPGEINEDILHSADLSSVNPAQMDAVLEKQVTKLKMSLDLSKGPLLRAAYFKTAVDKPDYFLLIIHHLVVDVVSWRILTEDLLSLYKQLSAGQPPKLPSKTTSFKYWAERINQYAASDAVHSELDFWNTIAAQKIASLPKDKNGTNTEADTQIVRAALSEEETEALLKEAPAAYHTQINELLLTALVRAAKYWHGQDSIVIEMEGHGREDLFEDVDISRTIGWFTSAFPVHLQLKGIVDPGESIKAVKEQYREIPNNGISFGLLKYLNEGLITNTIQPEIGFNYLGQFQQNSAENKLLGKPLTAPGFERSPDGERLHVLEIGGSVLENVFQITFAYSKEQYFEETIRNWTSQYLDELRVLIRHCQDPEAGAYTPSDFADVDLDEDGLGGLLEELED